MSGSAWPVRGGVVALRVLLGWALLVAVGCTDGDDEDAASTTSSSAVTTTTERASTTTTEPSTTTEPPPAPGSLESATVAIRAACREFYDLDSANYEERLPEEELAAKCDEPRVVEWRADCHHQRPAQFVPGDGGCAVLGGYLAVWYGRQDRDGGGEFEVGGDVWTVIPESD